ncbi:Uncharacterised protein [Segatella copri]|nr:Uncharacterised protein [Segatella copri]
MKMILGLSAVAFTALFCAIAACPGTSEAAMTPINALFFIMV